MSEPMPPGVPRASQWSPARAALKAPAHLLDFPDLKVGAAFSPDPENPQTPRPDAYITSRWLPFVMRWNATAVVQEITHDCVRWTESNQLGPVPFSAEVELRSTGTYTACLTMKARLWKLPKVPLKMEYEVIFAARNITGLRPMGDLADTVSVLRMDGDVVQFHVRLPFGITIQKSGTVH